jgi:hypothetical protein
LAPLRLGAFACDLLPDAKTVERQKTAGWGVGQAQNSSEGRFGLNISASGAVLGARKSQSRNALRIAAPHEPRFGPFFTLQKSRKFNPGP